LILRAIFSATLQGVGLSLLLNLYYLTCATEEIIIHAYKDQQKDREKFLDKSTGLEMEQAEEPQPLLEWFTEKYKDFGANLEFVTNRSQEGAQFVKGFGGIGGLLRYKVDFNNLTSVDEEDDEFYSDEDVI
jgi:peptide chain release factor subunit 1